MPVLVKVSGRPVLPKRLSADRVETALRQVCKRSVETLHEMILGELRRYVAHLEVSESAKKQIPALANVARLFMGYESSFRVEETPDGSRLAIDRSRLQQLGLPKTLPEILEYGSEIGVSPVAHLRTAWRKFLQEAVYPLAEEVVRELD